MALTAPPGARNVASTVATRLTEVREDNGRERVSVEWRGQPRSLDVITMPVELLYYNPDTHRVRAQRTLDPAREQELIANPWSTESQDYLHSLLKGDPSDPTKEDPAFRALSDDLRDHGQNDPGIITPDGILVNGNTRRAALKELGYPHIRVGVLPSDWSWDDVSAVELALQLRREYRREYSFINSLIAIDEQVARGRAPADIARDFRIKLKTFHRARWLFSFINEAIERSKVASGDGEHVALRLVDFERHQGKLEELHRKVVTLEAKDRDAAEILKETRLAALVLDFSKTDLRIIEEDFFTAHVHPKLGDAVAPAAEPAGDVSIPGLDVAVPDASPAVKQARAVTTALLQARAVTSAADGESSADSPLIESARKTFASALHIEGKNQQYRKRQLATPDRINDAADMVEAAVQQLVAARASAALDEDAFDESLVALRKAIVRLAQQANRSGTAGEGVTWLNHAAAQPGEH